MDQIIAFLRHIELFRGLTDQEYELLTCCIKQKSFKPDELLFRENGPRDCIYVIYDGEIELFKTNPYGAESRLTFFSKGDFLGEGPWADESPHSTSARAVVQTTVLTLEDEAFNKQASTTLKIFSNIARVISRRMRFANTRTINPAAQYESGRTRLEHDLLGERDVPFEYYYGIQSLRAIENFAISGVTLSFYPGLINALTMVKEAAAEANFELGLLDENIKNAIVSACREIRNGKFHSHFVVDMIQGGAGTSTNMNANEVIANRALEILGYQKGQYAYCHPNNHVNLSQSTNDAYPTAIKIALINANKKLVEVLQTLIASFQTKAEAFAHVIKMGRTQLQDAVPPSRLYWHAEGNNNYISFPHRPPPIERHRIPELFLLPYRKYSSMISFSPRSK